MSGERSTSDVDVGPSQAEIEAWATRERRRREQWAQGPTREQAALFALQQRERHSFEQQHPTGSARRRGPFQRALRDIQLAAIGAVRLVLNTSLEDALEYLVQTGLDWEEEASPPRGPART